MKIIGITGGVGAGKSEILKYIRKHYKVRIILADQVANDLKLKGESCYEPLVKILGEDVLSEDGQIDKGKMAQIIFGDEKKLKAVNDVLHPAVRAYITEQIELEKQKKEVELFLIEAALLIEEHYDEIVDELWYVFADEKVRRQRLKESRGYSDEKIDAIMGKQLPEEIFRTHCGYVIDNSHGLVYTYQQIDRKMSEE